MRQPPPIPRHPSPTPCNLRKIPCQLVPTARHAPPIPCNLRKTARQPLPRLRHFAPIPRQLKKIPCNIAPIPRKMVPRACQPGKIPCKLAKRPVFGQKTRLRWSAPPQWGRRITVARPFVHSLPRSRLCQNCHSIREPASSENPTFSPEPEAHLRSTSIARCVASIALRRAKPAGRHGVRSTSSRSLKAPRHLRPRQMGPGEAGPYHSLAGTPA